MPRLRQVLRWSTEPYRHCPVEGCSFRSPDLFIHLRGTHGLTEREAKNYFLLKSGVCQRAVSKHLLCLECQATVPHHRFINHLRQFHEYERPEAALFFFIQTAVQDFFRSQTIVEETKREEEEIDIIKIDEKAEKKDEKEGSDDEVEIIGFVENGQRKEFSSKAASDKIINVIEGSNDESSSSSSVIVVSEESSKKESEEPSKDQPTDEAADGSGIVTYPIVNDVVNFLDNSRSGVRFEKRLTGKDVRKLVAGELSFDEYKEMKNQIDRKRAEDFSYRESREREKESASGDESEMPKKKYKMKSEEKETEVNRCRLCQSYRLRVVNYGREDGKNILECANRKCLATIRLTDLPAGTFVEVPLLSEKNCGWMMDSVKKLSYPPLDKLANGELTANPVLLLPESHEEVKFIHCPGQTSLVRLM